MEGMKARYLLVIALVLGAIMSACPALGQTGTTKTEPIWPTYHYDTPRAGQNPHSTDAKDPSTIKAIWAFPRANAADEKDTVADDSGGNFSTTNNWHLFDKVNDAVLNDYHMTDVVMLPDKTSPPLANPPTATWTFPSNAGRYQIFVWVPVPDKTLGVRVTTKATYTVNDDYGGHTYTLDQVSNADTWALLTNDYFTFTNTNRTGGANFKTEGVTVSAVSDDISQNGRVVLADAVKFGSVPWQEIYSSPASANIPCILTDPDITTGTPPVIYNDFGTCVYTGTVEHSTTSAGAAGNDKGAVYCIYSVTPTIRTPRLVYDPNNPTGPKGPTNPDNPDPDPGMPNAGNLIKISKYLGVPKWRYPRNGTNPLTTDYINSRSPIEGPIAGGVFSSPTLATVQGSDASSNKLVCFVTGMLDRQMYALDAITGELLWKGPGFTIGEESDASVVSDWLLTDTREDAFGGKFHYTPCVDPSATSGVHRCTWKFDKEKDQPRTRPTSVDGYAYNIYAWIPEEGGTGGLLRSRNATYIITYPTTDPSKPATDTVTVDQSDKSTWGTWVKVGHSYFNPTQVELDNTASPDPVDPDHPTTPLTPADYAVVADALMFVPDTVDGMGYSTPITDTDPTKNTNGLAKLAYTVTANGRVLAFDLNNSAGGIGKLAWIYPAVRTKLSPSGSEEADQPDLGEMSASPALSSTGKLVVAGMNGTVTCLTAGPDAPKQPDWSFVSDTDADGQPSGFSSSPAIDGSNVYVASTGGFVYRLDLGASGKVAQAPSQYPAIPKAGQTGDNPLGSFRYSTPAIAAPKTGPKRVWVGSTDGHIYSFNADDLSRLYTDDTGAAHNGPPNYDEPSFGLPVQGSVALDGPGSGGVTNPNIIMYVGDIGDRSGTLHWRDAETGQIPRGSATDANGNAYAGWTAPGILFSSPSITNLKVQSSDISYVFAGCGDGHLIAFSKAGGAWGGEWQGGEWPFPGDADTQSAQRTASAPDTKVQFDVFDEQFFNNSLNVDPEPDPTTFVPSKWPDTGNGINDAIVSLTMKVPNSATPFTALSIDTYLTDEAKKRRVLTSSTLPGNVLAPSRANLKSSDTVFYEWGERIYCIVWNLPEQLLLDGTSLADKVKPRMTNQSCGESAGATSGGQTGNVNGLVMQVRAIKDYSCLALNSGVYGPLMVGGEPVKRSYCLISIDIDGSRDRPPGPGPGWALYIDIDKKTSPVPNAPVVHETIPLAKLTVGKGGGYDVVTVNNQIREAPLGINNPLAITDDGIKNDAPDGGVQIGWKGANGYTADRGDIDAHLNGNFRWESNSSSSTNSTTQPYNFSRLPTPLMYLQQVVHGTSSRQAPLGVMDRSCMGISYRSIPRFRIASRDLTFRGDNSLPNGALAAIECPPLDPITGKAIQSSPIKYGFKFPWDMGIGSIDYPYIYTRYQNYQLISTDIDPSTKATPLLPVVPTATPATQLNSPVRRDVVLVSADVPRFQPANETTDFQGAPGGYSRTMVAYVDSNGDGSLDSGNTNRGRPTTWQEAYRTFRVELKVPPDPKLQVDEQLIDVGRAPHGLGQNMTGPFAFSAYNKNPLIQQWFKPITIKNAGNVNLYNIRLDQVLGLLGDQASASQKLPGIAITSSLDITPPDPFGVFNSDPFLCSAASDAAGNPRFLGYTLSKPRVGDVDPTVMTVPDRRRWDNSYDAKSEAQSIMSQYLWDTAQPLPVMVSVRVPLTQPIGTYQSWDATYGVPYVSVFSDQTNLSANGPVRPTYGTDPMAVPSFQLKLAVRENQLTGGATPTTLPMIDYLMDGTAPPDQIPKYGDATPAAYRDANNMVHLFWSSNRLDPSIGAPVKDAEFAKLSSAPWFIHEARLGYNSSNWVPVTSSKTNGDPPHWWDSTGMQPTGNGWPAGVAPQATPMKWDPTQAGSPLSVRHFAPSIGENLAVPAANTANRTWLAWAGTLDVKNPDNTAGQESLIYYTDITAPSSSSSGNSGNNNNNTTPPVLAIEHDPSQQKRSPAALPDGTNMWMFWQGGNASNWSINYSFNTGGPAFIAQSPWAADVVLKTPASLASTGSPNPILRHLWADIRTPSSGDFTDPFTTEYNDIHNVKKVVDVVYAGTNKITRNADIFLSRYDLETADQDGNWVPVSAAALDSPSRMAQPLPRVYNERLARDPKLGFYTAQHIAWIRPKSGAVPVLDNWGEYNTGDHVTSNYPFVHVRFPKAYAVAGLTALPVGSDISATDGSVTAADGTVIEPGMLITPEIDTVSGVYTYSYTRPSSYSGPNYADKVLGKMIVDYSSGIIRFKNALIETPDTTVPGTTAFSAPEVYADYTPQAWRITTDSAVDGSPRAFIERTSMTDQNDTGGKTGVPRVTPGLDPSWESSKPAPVDRLWVFWRKTGAAIENSTIFYTTMRIGIDLTKLGLPPIAMDPLTGTIATGANNPNLVITGARGPWEVDRTGNKIYFSEVDERYQSQSFTGPGPIHIQYTYRGTGSQAQNRDISVSDVTWLTELPEQSLGFMMDSNVNEGSIYAFADPQPQFSGTSAGVRSSKIWVFWTSTRGGNSDLFWETLSPNFWGR